MAKAYADLHEMLDRLTPDQASAIRAVMVMLMYPAAKTNGTSEGSERQLSFVGLIPDGPPDLASAQRKVAVRVVPA